ncbi:DUF2637 domain-containing protein [Kitasatospora sp. McL0602]|uniref:DUF2637 domain-containing protein n=1 Tax=Kitasatospora sp. McL0602 TaxID=3439530 RepID=UPI003F886F2B
MSPEQVRSAERTLSVGTWAITFGAVLYSVLTVTPLMAGHSPKGWGWTAPILPLVVDAAVVIVVRLDSTLARLGGRSGRWPVALRWMTGTMTLLLNIGLSALDGDLVGVAVHSVAPLLLIVTAEASLAYRRAITTALLAREHAARAERDERDQRAQERQRQALAARIAEQDAAERRERERREHEAALAREGREHEARMRREEREADERREAAAREKSARRESAERAERERREREMSGREHAARERERREREATERADRERREAVERLARDLLDAEPVAERMPESQARKTVAAAYAARLPQRRTAELTGWSAGWIAARYAELREDGSAVPLAA